MRKKTELSVGYLIHECARLYRRDFERRARDIGLTRAQWTILAHLARNEGDNQVSVADTLELQPITLARTLDRMAEAGWVERRPDPEDRRARLLYLTDKAWQVLDRMYPLAMETREVALAGMSAEAREQLIAVLAQLRTNLLASAAPTQDEDQTEKASHA